MPARKRARQEADLDSSIVAVEKAQPHNETLDRLRNMWQFAALMQYMYIFGKPVKIDPEFDMEDLEHECLRPEASEKLAEICLTLLKFVSSHRGLTYDNYDEYTRRQFVAKAPSRNPYGDEEEPNKFAEFDVFTKIRVLHQLSTWTLNNAERMRGLMEEKDSEQTQWRIEELGWDSQDRSYFVLDDDRLYRRTEAPLPPAPTPKPKAKAKAKARKSRGSRASKRIKLDNSAEDGEAEEEEQDNTEAEVKIDEPTEEDGFGGMKWECIAVTHDDYNLFLESLRKSRDPNEKALVKRINEQIMPILEKRVEAQRQKVLKKQRELENLQKMASAKRSSRLAGKAEARKAEEEAAEVEKRRQAELDMARKEQQRQSKMEHIQARESRMLTREQRLKEREVKRILHEEELRKLEENQKSLEQGNEIEGRLSERHLKAEMERRQKELDALAEEEGEWIFDCAVCGKHGQNYDDGTHSIACEKCNIWQHSKCHGIDEKDAEKDDFHFVCSDCERKPKLPPLHLHFPGQKGAAPEAPRGRPLEAVEVSTSTPRSAARHFNLLDGPSLSPSGQSPGPPGYHRPAGAPPVGVPQQAWNGTTLPPPARPASNYSSSPPPPTQKSNDGDLSNLHAQAHAGAVSAHSVPLPALQPNGLQMGPPSPTKGSRPSSSHGLPEHRTNGSATPHHHRPSRNSLSPSGQRLFQSPNTSFPPPALPQQQQRAAAHSPTKQPSSSPSHAQSFHTPAAANATPYTYQHTTTATPASAATNILRTGPHMQSSPLPPLPTGNTPLIPTKHDTPRPISRDSMAETPVVPPITALSPSPAIFMPMPSAPPEGVEGVETSLGVGSVPVKKMPPSASQESDGDISMADM
ncbi:hypothetical protein D6D18_05282 [Aureobasidium pullulans]|nr:hypothetical protein D6D18_05282 [Aureobasidium pullulans]